MVPSRQHKFHAPLPPSVAHKLLVYIYKINYATGSADSSGLVVKALGRFLV